MSEWISVKDGLPENCEVRNVLAYGKSGMYPTDKKEIEFCKYYNSHFLYGEYDFIFIATHWMPLPEGPKECCNRMEKLKDLGLIGCLNDTGVNSDNYKDIIKKEVENGR